MKVTPEKKAAFCAALTASGGSVSRACEAIDIARLTAYRWRRADEEFAAAWDEAKDAGLDALEDEALRRAFEGVEKPVVYQGVITDTMREYSDTLTIFLLKGGRPEKYRENSRMELTGANGGPVQLDDLQASSRMAALVAAAKARQQAASDALDDLAGLV